MNALLVAAAEVQTVAGDQEAVGDADDAAAGGDLQLFASPAELQVFEVGPVVAARRAAGQTSRAPHLPDSGSDGNRPSRWWRGRRLRRSGHLAFSAFLLLENSDDHLVQVRGGELHDRAAAPAALASGPTGAGVGV